MSSISSNNLSFRYVNGLRLSKEVGLNTINITPGQCRDAFNLNDIVAPIALTCNPATIIGPNGRDSGNFELNSLYSIFAISDPSGIKPTATIASIYNTALLANEQKPSLPAGYGVYCRLGCFMTDSFNPSVIDFIQSGNGVIRAMWYSNPIQIVFGGNIPSTSVPFDLLPYVPKANMDVKIGCTVVSATDGTFVLIGANNNGIQMASGGSIAGVLAANIGDVPVVDAQTMQLAYLLTAINSSTDIYLFAYYDILID